MTSMGKTLAIVNPAARNGDGARGAAFLRYAAGSAVAPFEGIQIETTREAGHATALAAQASNFDCVLAVGGDGVVHETLAGLMRIPREKRPAFALIPCGNGNDYARTLGMSFVMEEALTQLSSAQRISADVGVCNGEYFAETLSFGLDAAIALGTYERRRRTGREGTRLFVEEGANQLVFHRDAYDFTAIADGGTSKQGSMHLFAVQVGPTYGGGFRVCPNADATDGKLDCCVAKAPLGILKAAYLFARAKDGKHVGHTGSFDFFDAKSLTLEFDREPPAQIDGEPIHGTKFDIAVLPGALDVYFAKGAAH